MASKAIGKDSPVSSSKSAMRTVKRKLFVEPVKAPVIPSEARLAWIQQTKSVVASLAPVPVPAPVFASEVSVADFKELERKFFVLQGEMEQIKIEAHNRGEIVKKVKHAVAQWGLAFNGMSNALKSNHNAFVDFKDETESGFKAVWAVLDGKPLESPRSQVVRMHEERSAISSVLLPPASIVGAASPQKEEDKTFDAGSITESPSLSSRASPVKQPAPLLPVVVAPVVAPQKMMGELQPRVVRRVPPSSGDEIELIQRYPSPDATSTLKKKVEKDNELSRLKLRLVVFKGPSCKKQELRDRIAKLEKGL